MRREQGEETKEGLREDDDEDDGVDDEDEDSLDDNFDEGRPAVGNAVSGGGMLFTVIGIY